jgi:hypothetical protein
VTSHENYFALTEKLPFLHILPSYAFCPYKQKQYKDGNSIESMSNDKIISKTQQKLNGYYLGYL